MLTTKQKYWQGNDYSQERKALHEKIITDALDRKTPANEPFFLLLGGGTGNGKGPMRRLLLGIGKDGEQIEDDSVIDSNTTVEIRSSLFKILPEYREHLDIQHPEKLPFLIDEYNDIVREIFNRALKRGYSVFFVDHADDKDFILSLTDTARKSAYTTALVGMGGDLKLYFLGAEAREKTLGWGPDHERGLTQTKVFSEHWDEYARTFDSSFLFGLVNESQAMLAKTISKANIPPEINGLDTGPIFVAREGPVNIDSKLYLIDRDDDSLAGAEIKIVNPQDGCSENLAVDTSDSNITCSYDENTHTLTLQGADTLANYQKVLESLVYDNTSNTPDITPRIIQYTISDGKDISVPASITLGVLDPNNRVVEEEIRHGKKYQEFREKKSVNVKAKTFEDAIRECPLHKANRLSTIASTVERGRRGGYAGEETDIGRTPSFTERLERVVKIDRPLKGHLNSRELDSVTRISEKFKTDVAGVIAFYINPDTKEINYSLIQTENRYGEFTNLELPKGASDAFYVNDNLPEDDPNYRVRLIRGEEFQTFMQLKEAGFPVQNKGSAHGTLRELGYRFENYEKPKDTGIRETAEEHGFDMDMDLHADKIVQIISVNPFPVQGKRGDYLHHVELVMIDNPENIRLREGENLEEYRIPGRIGKIFSERGIWGTLSQFQESLHEVEEYEKTHKNDSIIVKHLLSMKAQFHALEKMEVVLSDMLKGQGIETITDSKVNLRRARIELDPTPDIIKEDFFKVEQGANQRER